MATEKREVIVAIDLDTGGSVTNVGKLSAGLFSARKELKEFNKATKDQKELTEAQGQQLGKLTSNVKKYSSFLREATNESAGLTKAGLRFRDKMAGAFKTVNKSVKGFGLALKAAGIGLLVAAFGALKRILESQQPVLDAVETVFTFISIAVTEVGEAMKRIFESTKQSTGGFDALGKVMTGIVNIALTPFKLAFQAIRAAVISTQLIWEQSIFGGQDAEKITELKQSLSEVGDEVVAIGKGVVDSATDIATNFVEAASEVVAVGAAVVEEVKKIDLAAVSAQAKRTTELKKQAEISAAINAGLLQQFDRLAEKQRQIRDDETESIATRIAANIELGKVLEDQEKLMIKNAEIGIQAAALALAANDNTANRIALINAQTEAEDILAAVEGFRSEQIINRIALEKEANELNAEAALGEAERAKALRDFNAEQIEDDSARLEAKRENLEIEREIELERLQIILDTTKAGTQARIDAENEFLEATQDFELQKRELDTETAETKTDNEEAVASVRNQNAQDALKTVSGLLKEGTAAAKVAALAQIALDTGKAISGAIAAAQSVPFPGNLAAAASGIASALAGIANAKQAISAAAGGGDFVTTKPTLLLVGDNPGGRERVTVEPLSGTGQTTIAPDSGLIAMAGGGSLTVDRPQLSSQEQGVSNMNSSLAALDIAPVVSVIDIQSQADSIAVTDASVSF